MEKKRLSKFFADRLRDWELTDEQELTLQLMLFPSSEANPNRARVESSKAMAEAYENWEKEHQRKNEPMQAEPMTDAEIDALAAIM